jgi:hypothetical protein
MFVSVYPIKHPEFGDALEYTNLFSGAWNLLRNTGVQIPA